MLIEQAAARGGRTWVDQPQLSDEQVREPTGRGRADVEDWKEYWTRWLAALDEAAG